MPETVGRDVALAVWTRRFSRMVDAGVSLVHCLKVLEDEPTSGDMRDISHALRGKVARGDILSEAMRTWPDLFGEEYVSFVRMGEVGGVLDVALRLLVARIERGRLVRTYRDEPTRADVAEWFWWFGKMLEAGVPLLSALETLSQIGHPVLRDISQQMHEEVRSGFSLAPMSAREEAPGAPQPAMWRYPGIFTPTARTLAGFGVWHGPLAPALLGVAELLEQEARLEAEGKLPPLSAEQAHGPAPVAPGATHPVVHRVSELIKTLLRSEAEVADLRPVEEGKGVAVLQKADGEVVLTQELYFYPQVLRRIKLLAGLDPLARDEEGYRRSQIHVRVDDKEYKLLVRTGGDRLVLSVGKETDTVQL